MIDAVRAAGAAGVQHRPDLELVGAGDLRPRSSRPISSTPTVISGEVGLHKPQPEIYLLACERLGVEPAEAVFVDDLRENCDGAEAVGMTAVLHRDPAETVPELERAARARAQQRAPLSRDAELESPGRRRLDHGAAVRVAHAAAPRRRQ